MAVPNPTGMRTPLNYGDVLFLSRAINDLTKAIRAVPGATANADVLTHLDSCTKNIAALLDRMEATMQGQIDHG